MKYEVVDTFGDHIIGVYNTRNEALYGIRLYCVARMMDKVSLFDQDFVTLIDNGDYVTYDNPIGYFPNKTKFLVKTI